MTKIQACAIRRARKSIVDTERRIYATQAAEDARAIEAGERPTLISKPSDCDAWEERQNLSASEIACAVADAFVLVDTEGSPEAKAILILELDRLTRRLEAATRGSALRKVRP